MFKKLLLNLQISSLATITAITMEPTSQISIKEISVDKESKAYTTTLQNTQRNDESIVLLKKGYSNSQIKTIYTKLNQDQINLLLTKSYIDITEYLKFPYFDFSKLDQYVAYRRINHTDFKNTIIRVNIGLDQEFYTNVKTIENPDSTLVLVNKYNQLPADYVPSNLTALKCNPKYKLKQEAATAFDMLVEDASKDNVNVYPYSAYRSYDYQNTIYNNYINRDGQTLADTYSARPGHSEHQTGLAVDIKSVGHNEITREDYEWMKQNASKYGFIIRYPENTTEITGYQEEPWQLRYVGIEVASEIQELGITFDEYYQIKLANNTVKQSTQNKTNESNQTIITEPVNPTIEEKTTNTSTSECETTTYNISFDTTFTLQENSKIYRTADDIGIEDKALNPRNTTDNERVITGIIIEENGTRKIYRNDEIGNIKLEEAYQNNLSIIGILSNENEGFFRIEDVIPVEKQLTLK